MAEFSGEEQLALVIMNFSKKTRYANSLGTWVSNVNKIRILPPLYYVGTPEVRMRGYAVRYFSKNYKFNTFKEAVAEVVELQKCL